MLNITWAQEPASSIKFKGTQTSGPAYELTLTRAADGSSTTASMILGSTNNGSMTLPGDYEDVKAFFTAVGAGL